MLEHVRNCRSLGEKDVGLEATTGSADPRGCCEESERELSMKHQFAIAAEFVPSKSHSHSPHTFTDPNKGILADT